MAKLKVIATVINDLEFDQRMIRICNSLTSFDYDVTLIGRKLSNRPTVEKAFAQKRIRMMINKGPLFYLLYNIRLFFILLTSKVDIIHSVDLDTLLAAYLVAKIRSKKLVYDAHEWFTEVPELLNRPAKRKVWLLLENALIKRLNNGITVSASIASEFESMYGTRFQVIRNCPIKQQSEEQSSAEKYLLYQGALNVGRGLELLIDSMQEVDVKLKIAGKGDIEDELKQKVRSLGLEKKVEFLGNLNPEELRSVTQKAYIGYNLSENLGKSYYYSLNNKFFDYVQSGLPAITNKFPEYMNLNEEFNCCVFADHDKDDLIKTINLLLDDAELYGKLKKNCFLAAEVWNWQYEELKLKAFYAELS